MYWSTWCCQELLCILSNLKMLIEQSKNENPAHQKWVQVCETCQFICLFFRIINRTCFLVVRSKWNAADDICSNSMGPETLCILLTILHGTKPVSGLIPALLYCSALYHSFFLKTKIFSRQGRSSIDGVLQHEHLASIFFGKLGVGLWAPSSLHLQAWRLGRDYMAYID